jgi:hypothetical protein
VSGGLQPVEADNQARTRGGQSFRKLDAKQAMTPGFTGGVADLKTCASGPRGFELCSVANDEKISRLKRIIKSANFADRNLDPGAVK